MDEIELARWQGEQDEKVNNVIRRLDNINGDIASIKYDIGNIKKSQDDADKDRVLWIPWLRSLKQTMDVNTAMTKNIQDQKLFNWKKKHTVTATLAGAVIIIVQAVEAAHQAGAF